MANLIDPAEHPATQRLRDLREKLGFKKKSEFAKLLGISIARWSNVENGYPISRDVAERLKHGLKNHVDLDYIYSGETGDLTVELCYILQIKPRPGQRHGSEPVPLGKDFGKNGAILGLPLATRRKGPARSAP